MYLKKLELDLYIMMKQENIVNLYEYPDYVDNMSEGEIVSLLDLKPQGKVRYFRVENFTFYDTRSIFLTELGSRVEEYNKLIEEGFTEDENCFCPNYKDYIVHVRVDIKAVLSRNELKQAIYEQTYEID